MKKDTGLITLVIILALLGVATGFLQINLELLSQYMTSAIAVFYTYWIGGRRGKHNPDT